MATRCANCSRWLEPDEVDKPCPRCGSIVRVNFDNDRAVVDEKYKVATELAKKHFQAEPGLERIFRITGNADVELMPIEPIKLLEVNQYTVPSGVLPVQFGPAPASGIPYASVIVEVSPDEFKKIQANEIRLPKGWRIDDEILKPHGN